MRVATLFTKPLMIEIYRLSELLHITAPAVGSKFAREAEDRSRHLSWAAGSREAAEKRKSGDWKIILSSPLLSTPKFSSIHAKCYQQRHNHKKNSNKQDDFSKTACIDWHCYQTKYQRLIIDILV